MKWLKQLVCRHSYQIIRWHWTHGPTGNDPLCLEVEHKCSKCGKIAYSYHERGSGGEEFILTLTEKEW